MSRFADVLQDLVGTRGLTNVRWASIANEPNSTAIHAAAVQGALPRVGRAARARGLRGQIGLIGGDLVQCTEGHRGALTVPGSTTWSRHMNDVIDAWSEHIYWNYGDHFRMEERLKDVAHLVDQELPVSARKPTFIMEYGVRGYNTCGTKPTAHGRVLPRRRLHRSAAHEPGRVPEAVVHDRLGAARLREVRRTGISTGRPTT